MEKQRVSYYGVCSTPHVGIQAELKSNDVHPRLGCHPEKVILTSMVVEVRDNGEIETLNTIYYPEYPSAIKTRLSYSD